MNEDVRTVAINWVRDTPLSVQHQDFYFSLKNGLDESRYVFLKANDLPQRFSCGAIQQPFVIGETGFGTGLNFLAAWQSWQELEGPKRPLRFISVEKYPLSKTDLKQCLDCWPQLAHLSDELLRQYPKLSSGMHELNFSGGEVSLRLLIGDANADLDTYDFAADCWFLDGFSPSKNPSMWTDALFETVASHSSNATTLSTFTAASAVRRGLQKAGFSVTKLRGFGAKREMISARLALD